MDLGISGKVALVTGGSKGIGRRISEMLGAEGCKVVVAAREQAAIDATVDAIRATGGKAIGVAGDLTEVGNYAAAVEVAKSAFGPPEIAIYNMLAPKPGAFSDLDDDDFRLAYHLVHVCYMNMVRAVLPGMKDAGWGRVVTVGSGTAKSPLRTTPFFSYVLANATRPGAIGLNKTLAGDYGRFGITFNTIGVGAIVTEQSTEWLNARAAESGRSFDDIMHEFFANNPLNRPGKVDEVASLALFLCSQGSGFTTGETILCDGGQVEGLL
ncbi:SDR family oxidoreductase [Sphingobium sp. TCM1]|uniref:SDR family oxidoreductase n=1 Tax=Sphingobium sp. TCM1 TaxID=453246 RepID=UPI0007F3952B|nr:SDR family oxidoreductase [Sphingobium sp. TCM1]OAN56223.1 hypothetical protein A7Q26_02095 [Sphingobium sp. TCM1]